MPNLPAAQGLYDPAYEHDACGVAFVVDLQGRRSHDLVAKGVAALCHLEHRGASGAEENSGDGAGILLQVPDAFLRAVAGFDLPPAGAYATGIAFLPPDPATADEAVASIDKIAASEGLRVLGWRDVPVDPSSLGSMARDAMPSFRQLFLTGPEADAADQLQGMALERRAFVVRKRIEHEIVTDAGTPAVYFPSLSARTLVYKGMLTTPQLERFYPDLADERVESALALVHSRFSTNTFPSWELAHPYRLLAHNGEINTVMGNRNWMRAREALLASEAFDGPGQNGDGSTTIDRIFPICTPGASDSATFDEVLELLELGGRPLHHAVLMMVPEAWENHASMDPAKRAFYEFHASLMEPWDGPASVAFTDGTVIGAVLDRNGLRPSRYWVTDDGLVVMASEVGVLPIDPSTVVRKGRLQPGRMFLVDTSQGRIVDDEEIKATLAAEHPYQEWLDAGLVHVDELPERPHTRYPHASVLRRQQTFGYTTEELKILLAPMARTGGEALGSMGTDTPLAVLSERPRLLFDYFSQLFAQVTNPPLDAIREELVTSLRATIGAERNLLDPGPESCRQIVLPFPILDNDELAKLLHVNDDGSRPEFATAQLDGLYRVADGGPGLRAALDDLTRQASEAITGGARLLILSDRHSTAELAPIPSLLLTSAIHHHLVRQKLRAQAGLILETGEAREVHHMALLIGYGASAINPYLAFETVEDMLARGSITDIGLDEAVRNYIKASGKGVLKVMSKMGISTVASYTGAQVFEAVGLSQELVDAYFTGTTSKLGGIGLDELAEEVARRHRRAHLTRPEERAHRELEVGGEYQWRREGEYHLFNPETVFKLQHGTRTKRYDIFKQYTRAVDEQAERLATLRGLFRFKTGERPAVPLDEVEPVSAIVARFSTGAMSYGSISMEAHQTLAVAMNRIGGKSNTGEGGEDPERLYDPERRSSIKQVASGRFGVTSEYLTNADDIQIKMAQGAKPGEGGQLPGRQGLPLDRQDPLLHARRGAHQPAAPPRHLLHRGPGAAHPRPQELQPGGPRPREARGRGRGRHGGHRGLEGARRRGAHLGPRRGHRRQPAHLAQARRWALGARAGRDPADAAAQPAARPHRGAGRRAAQDGPRRRHRRAARRRGVRLRHRSSGGVGLHHDARLPPRHLPGGHRHPEPGAARALQRQAGVRRDLLRVRRRGGPRAARRARLPLPRRGHRPRRGARRGAGRRPLEGARPRPVGRAARAGAARRRPPAPDPRARTTASTGPSTTSSSSTPLRPSTGARRSS